METSPRLGLISGIGLVASSMIGVGVLVSAGWAASVLDPGEILLAWLVGGAIALCGARAYAALAELIPRSGGEYRYLSDLLHPVLGTMAGWASLFLGFAAPVAFCAAMADAYASTLIALPPHAVGITIIAAITLLGMLSARATQRVQDALALAKVALFTLFLAVGAVAGSHAWPTWTSEVPHRGVSAAELRRTASVGRRRVHGVEYRRLRERGVSRAAPRRAAGDADRHCDRHRAVPRGELGVRR